MVRWRKKNSGAGETQRSFLENGSLLLERLIASNSDGKSNPIKSFSADQILKATDNFDKNNVVRVDTFQWYRGTVDDHRPVLIKKWRSPFYPSEKIYRDIAFSSKFSGHKNFLKLLGCCLEFTYPVLVCEYAVPIIQRGTAFDPTLPWNMRIKIAKEIANAVAYIHSAFSRTLIHKDIKPRNVFLDENATARLSDFCNCVSIPEGKKFVQDIIEGTSGYVEPDHALTGIVTENTDVYPFGILMQVLLTRRCPDVHPNSFTGSLIDLVEDGGFVAVVDPLMLDELGEAAEQEQWRMEAFFELSLRCTGHKGNVPKMIEVAKELKRIERSREFPSANEGVHPSIR